MPTLTHLCGFEEEGHSDGPFGVGAHGYTDGGNADGLSWDGAIKRNGRFALKAQSGSALYQYFAAATNHIVGSLWFRWNALSTNTQLLLVYNVGAGFRVSSGGVVSASAGGTYTNGPTVAADTWHQIDFYWNGSANPRVMKWQVNQSAQTDVSYAAAATTCVAIVLGMAPLGGTGAMYYDDWALSETPADYPIGPVAVEALYPTGDGTHVGQSKFKDELGNTSTGSSTYLKVDDSSISDFWYTDVTGTTDYLEWTLPNTTRANAIYGVAATAIIRKSGFFPGDAAVKLRANATDGTIYSGDFGWATEMWFAKTALFLTAPGGASWTATLINGATVRAGYAADASPQPYWGAIIVEVAYDDLPNESSPTEPVYVPGIWVDWIGNGTWVEETARVISVNWSRGASSDHVSAPGPGNATVVLQNSDGRFNPDNSGSPLYGLLLPNRPIWCGADRTTGSLTTATEVRGFFAGYVTEIVPTPVPGGNPTAELICEDALGVYRRATATVSPARGISRGEFRRSVLTSIGESVNRRDLESEADMLPFASADTRDGLALLDDLNRSNSTRNYIAPADSLTDWYWYTTVNRLHKLAAAADEAWNADDVTALSGYRVTVDNIVNLQRATVSPIDFSSLNEVVWTATPLPLVVTVGQPITLWPEFADYVFDAAVIANSTGGTLGTSLTNFGTSAKLVLTATGSVVNITRLDVTGSSLRRGDLQTVRSEDTASQAIYEIRAGGDVSTDLIGQPGAAKAVTDYLIWKFADPLKRPSLARAAKGTATITSILDRDLFDVITLTVDRLHVVSRRFEIVGLRGTAVPKAANVPFYEVTYELQETPNQAAIDYFLIDEDAVNGAALIAPF